MRRRTSTECPVGFQYLVIVSDLQRYGWASEGHAARSYSWIKPPRTFRRRISAVAKPVSLSRSGVTSCPQHAPDSVLAGKPAVVFFGNNPAGRPAIPGDVPGEVYLGFPGVGGVITRGVADYVQIRQQPTALPEASDPRLAALESAMSGRGFAVQRVADMDGWLAYHAAFVACVAAALYRCGTDPVRLAADRATLTIMCRAITGAFAALRTDGTAGLPRNLAVLHSPLLRAVAVRYWARTMRSPMGELCFAAHSRHAEAEMRALGQDVAARITDSPALTELLSPLVHQP
jgi:2-dehydropantoate 2-reductase